jgi:DME family drug/metabolite transporter
VRRLPGPVLILLAAVLWGTTGTSQALGPSGADPLAVGTLRLVVGAAGLGVVALGGTSHTALPRVALLVTGLGIAAYQLTFFSAVQRAGVALGTVVAIGSAPVLAGAVGWLAERERPTRRWTAATVLAVAGVAAIVGVPGTADPAGIALALGAGLSYAVYAAGSKRLVRAVSPSRAMAAGFGTGALLLLPVLVLRPPSFLGDPGGLPMALWLGLATVTASYLLFGAGIRVTPIATTATLSLAEPLVATLLGVLLLGERPRPLAWTGMALVIVGLLVVGVPARRFRRVAD